MFVGNSTEKPFLILATDIVSNDSAEKIRSNTWPRRDYLELARRLGADWMDYSVYQKSGYPQWVRSAEKLLRTDFGLGWAAFACRRQCELYISTSEKVSLPLSLLLLMTPRRPRHLVIISHLTSPRKRWLVRWMGLMRTYDRVVCLASAEKDWVARYFGLAESRLTVIHHGVDHLFYKPEVSAQRSGVLSVGKAHRDYETLIQAASGLEAQVHIRAASAWYSRYNSGQQVTLPANVEFIGYMSPHELRSMYAQAKFVVVPLRRTTQYGAGCATVLEAMAMGRAVIASRHPGMSDYVHDGETGILVEPGDVQGLRQAMCYLLDHPEEADRMGARGRQVVEEEFNLDIWLRKMVAVVQEVLAESIGEEKSPSESCS